MTIDETIEKEKYLAVINCDLATSLHTDENIYSREEEICRQKAEYHGQIAEWLKELKAYEEAKEEIKRKMKSGQMGKALLIMSNHIREVNADADSN